MTTQIIEQFTKKLQTFSPNEATQKTEILNFIKDLYNNQLKDFKTPIVSGGDLPAAALLTLDSTLFSITPIASAAAAETAITINAVICGIMIGNIKATISRTLDGGDGTNDLIQFETMEAHNTTTFSIQQDTLDENLSIGEDIPAGKINKLDTILKIYKNNKITMKHTHAWQDNAHTITSNVRLVKDVEVGTQQNKNKDEGNKTWTEDYLPNVQFAVVVVIAGLLIAKIAYSGDSEHHYDMKFDNFQDAPQI